jgi:hypothetical protein
VTTYDHEQLAQLLAALPPAPVGLVTAAQELPQVRKSLDDLLARAEADADVRRLLVADLESTLSQSGIRPTPRILDEVRARMHSL